MRVSQRFISSHDLKSTIGHNRTVMNSENPKGTATPCTNQRVFMYLFNHSFDCSAVEISRAVERVAEKVFEIPF